MQTFRARLSSALIAAILLSTAASSEIFSYSATVTPATIASDVGAITLTFSPIASSYLDCSDPGTNITVANYTATGSGFAGHIPSTPVRVDVVLQDVSGHEASVTFSGTLGGNYPNGFSISLSPESQIVTMGGTQYTIGSLMQTMPPFVNDPYNPGAISAHVTCGPIATSPPVASPDVFSTVQGSALTIADPGVLANDQNTSQQVLSVSLVSGPVHGQLALAPAGGFTYTPEAAYSGQDSFTYRVNDTLLDSDPATVTINVTPLDGGSTLVTGFDPAQWYDFDGNGAASVGEPFNTADIGAPRMAASGTFLTYNPSQPGDPDFSSDLTMYGYELTGMVTAVNATEVGYSGTYAIRYFDPSGAIDTVSHGFFAMTGQTSLTGVQTLTGSLTQDPAFIVPSPFPDLFRNGPLTYTGAFVQSASGVGPLYSGFIQGVLYGPTASGTAPVANPDAYTTVEDDVLVVPAPGVLGNDIDAEGDALTVSLVQGTSYGTLQLGASGGFIYTPQTGFSGTDSFAYRANDGVFDSSPATVTIDVAPPYRPPTAQDILVTTPEETPLTIPVLEHVIHPDGPASLESVTQPAHGQATIAGDTILYTPSPLFNGSDTFTYTVTDGRTPRNLSTATVTVDVTFVNDPPLANDDSATTRENESVTITVLGNDSDVDSGDVVTLTGVATPSHGSAVLQGDSIVYTPSLYFFGEDSFTYIITDTHQGTATATVRVTVEHVNQPPTANDDTATTMRHVAVTIDVLANDTDPDMTLPGDTLTIQSVGTPTYGTASIKDGGVLYSPDASFYGTDSFTYTITDAAGLTSTATVTVSVLDTNSPPVAHNDRMVVVAGRTSPVDVLGNDTDADRDLLSIGLFSQPKFGTVAKDGQVLSYTPTPGFAGQDYFTYRVTDGRESSDYARVDITVLPENQQLLPQSDDVNLSEDGTVSIMVLDNDLYPTGLKVKVVAGSSPQHGHLENRGTYFVYTPLRHYTGYDSFAYAITDGRAMSGRAWVSIYVSPMNHAPFVTSISAATSGSSSVEVNVLANCADIDSGDEITLSGVSDPSAGSVGIVGPGLVRYTPPAPTVIEQCRWVKTGPWGQKYRDCTYKNVYYTGIATFTYTVRDRMGYASQATITVAVGLGMAPPDPRPNQATTSSYFSVTIPVLANDLSTGGGLLSLLSVDPPYAGNAWDNPDGTVTYTPVPGFRGIDTFTYVVKNARGETNTGRVTVNVQ